MATIRKRGEYQWQCQVRRKGYPPQSHTFNTRADAEAWARAIESEMDRGQFVSRVEAESTTLYEALDRYADEISVDKKGVSAELYRIRQLKLDTLAKRSMASIRGTDLAAYRDKRLANGLAPASVVRELAVLSHLFNVARREWGMESLANPVQLIRRPQVKNERERRIQSAEVFLKQDGVLIREVLDEAELVCRFTESAELPAIIRLAIETAMRRSEILALTRDNIDLRRRVARLPETKNGSSRDIPLSSKAVKILDELPRRLSGRVFCMRGDAVTRAFIRAANRAREAYLAGVREHLAIQGGKESQIDKTFAADTFMCGLHFHDLRHEATSRLAEIYPMHELAKITGHKDTRMLLRYYHPRAEDLAKKLA